MDPATLNAIFLKVILPILAIIVTLLAIGGKMARLITTGVCAFAGLLVYGIANNPGMAGQIGSTLASGFNTMIHLHV